MINDEIKETSVIIKQIPKQFKLDDCKELFSFFIPKSTRFLPSKESNTAILTFSCPEDAYSAVYNLHERKIMNNYLCVKILRKPSTDIYSTQDSCTKKLNEPVLAKDNITHTIPDWVKGLLSLAPSLNFREPIKPKLRYKYPKPDNIILTNVVRALISNEKFYTQTLHLMNKFHFPVPFSPDITFPGTVVVVNPDESIKRKRVQSDFELTEMEISSGNESEIADDFQSTTIKRRKVSLPKIRNIPTTSMTNYPFNSHHVTRFAIDELFDRDDSRVENQIKLNLTSSVLSGNGSNNPASFTEEEGFGKIAAVCVTTSASKVDPVIENIRDNFRLRKGDAVLTQSDVQESVKKTENSNDKFHGILIERPEKMLSMEEISGNRLSSALWSSISAFRNYEAGLPSSRLYVKNLDKKVVKNDLVSLYSGFVDWTHDDQVRLFSITCFTEGRMKGQAFVNLPSTAISERALEMTNAFLLHDRPIIVQFAKVVHRE